LSSKFRGMAGLDPRLAAGFEKPLDPFVSETFDHHVSV